jgi:chloramphenicol 3-O phosphotransferase
VIIVLNGTSSAGKTTLAKALQDALPEPYLAWGIDTVVYALPRRYLGPLWSTDVFSYGYAPDGSIAAIHPAPYGDRLVRGLHAAVAALARAGIHVIVDHVLLAPAWAADLAAAFAGLDVVRVGVLCPLAELQRREKERGDRTLGQARAQFDLVHAAARYDVTVDTSRADPAGCAARVLAVLAR